MLNILFRIQWKQWSKEIHHTGIDCHCFEILLSTSCHLELLSCLGTSLWLPEERQKGLPGDRDPGRPSHPGFLPLCLSCIRPISAVLQQPRKLLCCVSFGAEPWVSSRFQKLRRPGSLLLCVYLCDPMSNSSTLLVLSGWQFPWPPERQ